MKAPEQLAIDRSGNLSIASTSHVRVVLNRGVGDGLDAIEPDGDDGVENIDGSGDVFPEPEDRCIRAIAVVDDPREAGDPDDGALSVTDACFGTVAGVRG